MDREHFQQTYVYDINPPPYESQPNITHGPKSGDVGILPANVFVNTKLEKFSAITTCSTCNLPVQTNVEKIVNAEGWAWAILCCCFGSPFLAFLVWFVDCFNEWIHRCPRCNKILSRHTPSASWEVTCLLLLATLVVMALLMGMIGFYMYYLLPKMELEHIAKTQQLALNS